MAFLRMLLGTLDASLLGNVLEGKWMIKVINSILTENVFLRVGYGSLSKKKDF